MVAPNRKLWLVIVLMFVVAVLGLTFVRYQAQEALATVPEGAVPISPLVAYLVAIAEWVAAIILAFTANRNEVPLQRLFLQLLISAALIEAGFLIGWLATMGRPFASILPFAVAATILYVVFLLPVGSAGLRRFEER